jgi:ABC-type multidrug transport system ATPase subunit
MAEIALGFRNLTVTSNGTDLLSGVSGYVDRGCITAVLGASAAGKSVLLQTLSGRIQNLEISGDVYMDGSEVDPKALGNPVAYVPQEDSLIGDLTAREVATNTALFKRNDAREKIDADVSDLLDRLGLTKVADGIIGTLIFRGLSGGQKKRAEIATELIAAPSILLLDEPTSGLDSKVAYDVLSTIRNIVKASNGMISVMLVIHQPNDKILSL